MALDRNTPYLKHVTMGKNAVSLDVLQFAPLSL